MGIKCSSTARVLVIKCFNKWISKTRLLITGKYGKINKNTYVRSADKTYLSIILFDYEPACIAAVVCETEQRTLVVLIKFIFYIAVKDEYCANSRIIIIPFLSPSIYYDFVRISIATGQDRFDLGIRFERFQTFSHSVRFSHGPPDPNPTAIFIGIKTTV